MTTKTDSTEAPADRVPLDRLVGHGAIQKAWEDYHGPVDDDGYIPAMPPAFMRGFVDGFEHARNKVIEECAEAVQTQIRGTRYQWESESHFGTMTREMANRIRLLKSSPNVERRHPTNDDR